MWIVRPKPKSKRSKAKKNNTQENHKKGKNIKSNKSLNLDTLKNKSWNQNMNFSLAHVKQWIVYNSKENHQQIANKKIKT